MPRGILILKRIKYLIMIQQQDTFLEMQRGIFQIRQKIEHYWKRLPMILQISAEPTSMEMNGIQRLRAMEAKYG